MSNVPSVDDETLERVVAAYNHAVEELEVLDGMLELLGEADDRPYVKAVSELVGLIVDDQHRGLPYEFWNQARNLSVGIRHVEHSPDRRELGFALMSMREALLLTTSLALEWSGAVCECGCDDEEMDFFDD